MRDEPRDYVGYKSFERFVPAVLLPVERSVTLDDPAHVAGPVRTERDLRRRTRSRPEGLLHRAHRGDQTFLFGDRQVLEHRPDLIARPRLERCDGGPAARGKAKDPAAGVIPCPRVRHDPATAKAAEDP